MATKRNSIGLFAFLAGLVVVVGIAHLIFEDSFRKEPKDAFIALAIAVVIAAAAAAGVTSACGFELGTVAAFRTVLIATPLLLYAPASACEWKFVVIPAAIVYGALFVRITSAE